MPVRPDVTERRQVGINRERPQHREPARNPYQRPPLLHRGWEGGRSEMEGNGRFVGDVANKSFPLSDPDEE